MLKIDRKVLIGFSIILLAIASIITFSSHLYWIFSPPQSDLSYKQFDLPPNDFYFINYRAIFPYHLYINYLENGSIYSPNRIMFFNFTINGTNIKEFSYNNPYIHDYQNITNFDIGMYFYLFKTDGYNQFRLVQTQNKTYTIDRSHTYASGNYYWNYHSLPLLMTSNIKNTVYYYEFLITVTTHYYSLTNESYENILVQNYASNIHYHTSNHSQFVFEAIGQTDIPPLATFTYIQWGILNFAILVGGMVFIAITIIVLVLKNRKEV